MSKYALYRTIDRLRYFIETLQDAMGWQVELEKVSEDEHEYRVTLKFTLTFKGKAWPNIVRDSRFQLVVFEMVKNRLHDLWDEELRKVSD